MKIGILQFNPKLGAVEHNIKHANALIDSMRPGQLDLLVLPELAFTGYNFPTLEAIKPFLEPTAAGPTTEWAVHTATRLGCHIIAGYPEVNTDEAGRQKNFNATVTVSPSGQILSNYRKAFLYYTDETWALEGPDGSAPDFSRSSHSRPFFTGPLGRLGNVGHGICMDINPYRFTAPWTDYEFADCMLSNNVRLVVLSMAWLTHRLPEEIELTPEKPDMDTVTYWLKRFWPFLTQRPHEEIIVVFGNRCGIEGNRIGSVQVENGQEVEEGDRVCYAGSSCVMRFKDGEVRMFDRGEGVAILGKGEEGLLVVDTALVSGSA